MSRIKSLIEGAHRAVEMRWTVLCYDPEKDNELVESSKQFDCICAAQAHKRELAMKHPGYIIEIVAESKKAKNESIGQEIVDEVKEEIKAELKDAIGQDVDNAIGHPATEENLGAEVKDDMEAEEDELAMEEDIDDDSDSIFAPDDLDEVVGESAEDDFKTKSLGAIAIAKAAGFKVNDRASKKSLIVLDKGDKEVVIGLYDYGILDITAYDKGEDTYSDHWKIDKVSKADIEKATKVAIKSFNESAQKNEALYKIAKTDKEKEAILAKIEKDPSLKLVNIDRVVSGWKNDKDGIPIAQYNTRITYKKESAQKNEAVNATKVKQDVEKAVKDYFKNDKDALEYVYVDSKKDNHGRTVIEVRAELGYNGMIKLADHLDKVVQKHDRYAYFEQESGGIMTAVFESAQKNEAIGPEDTVTHAKQMEFKKQYVAKRKPKVNMSSFYFDGPFAVDDNTGTNISGAKLGMKCKDLEVALDKFFLEDAKGMKALNKILKDHKFAVNCGNAGKFFKTRQEAEDYAKLIKAGKAKDMFGNTIKSTEPVEIISLQESVTKANYNEIVKVLSDAIAKAAKKYPEAKLVKRYQATTGSAGVFLEEGLHFTDQDAVTKANAISDELFKAAKKFEPKFQHGKLQYMIGNHMASNIIDFGSISQGSNGASVGYTIVRDNLKFLESAQINESRNWKVTVELSAPDNMNNAYVEDTVEHFLDKAGLTVFDVTATRK